MGNVISSFVGSIVSCYRQVISKCRSSTDNLDFHKDNLLNIDKFQAISVNNNSQKTNSGSLKNEYQLLKNNEEVDLHTEKDFKEVEQLQNEIKSIPFDLYEDKEMVNTPSIVNIEDKENIDDLKSHILNQDV